MSVEIKKRKPKMPKLMGLLSLCLILVPLLVFGWMPLPERLSLPGSRYITYSDGVPAHIFLSADDKWRIPMDLDEVDDNYLQALIRYEDKRFWMHPGVDPIALIRALWVNVSYGEIKTGASTITMQLVRVLEPRPRTLRSKVTEIFRAIQLELHFSKKEILERYIQYISFGRNIEGVQAAAWSYFGHSANDLSPAEIATLLAVPQRPQERHPHALNVERLKKARDAIATTLIRWSTLPLGDAHTKITPEQLLAMIETSPVPKQLRSLPREIPHAAYWLNEQNDNIVIQTHLKRGLQNIAQDIFSSEKRHLNNKGIHNGAMVVVENDTGKVRALVGNMDFQDKDHGGEIQGFMVPRSPGSTLKPLIYAMAIDQGLVLPQTVILDIPATYAGYAPKNYSGNFQGLVTLESALSQSLNVPFVRLLKKINVEHFLGTLRSMGVESLQDKPGFYGLSAAIGGLELSALELANVYTTLANDGMYRALEIFAKDGVATSSDYKVLSPGATYLTRQALGLKDRPDFPSRRKMTGIPPHIFWKTGTSFGHRDAWSVGFNDKYTVVVWLGNFDQKGSSHLVGAQTAGPILFDVFDALTTPLGVQVKDPTMDLKEIEVCGLSGHLPGLGCTHTRNVLALGHSVPTKKCPYHVQVDIDDETGLMLTPTCRTGRSYHRETFVQWPSSLSRWLGDTHQRLPATPTLMPGCRAVTDGQPPVILSPRVGETHLLIPGLSAQEQEIPLEAETLRGTALSWFIDGHYWGTAAPAERLWWPPQKGSHHLVVTDETGASASRRIQVR